MALFYFSIGATDTSATLKERLDGIREDGANISYTIVSANEVNLKINELTFTVRYNLSKASTAQYFWYLCDAYKRENLVILCDSPNVNENGKENTLGLATYNRVYFRYKNEMIEIPFKEDTFATRFNLIKGRFNTFDDENENSDSVMLTRCTFNNSNEVDNGGVVISDYLYISSNLQDVNFKTIVKDENGNRFINVGGVFYMDNVDYVIKDSTCPLLIIVPDGRIKYEWNANTEIVNDIWLDTTKTVSTKFSRDNYTVQNNSVVFNYEGSLNLPLPNNIVDGFTLYIILKNKDQGTFPNLRLWNEQKEDIVYNSAISGIFYNSNNQLGLTLNYWSSYKSNHPTFTFPSYEEIEYLVNNNSFYTFNINISTRPLLVYVIRCSKNKNLSYDSPPRLSIFVKNKKFYDSLLSRYHLGDTTISSLCNINSIYINMRERFSTNNYGEVKYIGLQPSGETSDDEILENMQYLTKKFKLDQEG